MTFCCFHLLDSYINAAQQAYKFMERQPQTKELAMYAKLSTVLEYCVEGPQSNLEAGEQHTHL